MGLTVELEIGRQARLLVWVFARNDDTVIGELSIDPDAGSYDFRTYRPDYDSTVTVEHFAHVNHAFERQSEWEARLIRDGWTLTDYTSHLLAAAGTR